MKIATQTEIRASAEKVWETLLQGEKYSEWNPYLQTMEGHPAPDGTLKVKIFFRGESPFQQQVQVTGFIPPRYFSFSWSHSLGGWWFQAEQVFRIKEEEGRLIFHNELYVTGLRIRFGRKSMNLAAKLSMEHMNQALKERLEGQEG